MSHFLRTLFQHPRLKILRDTIRPFVDAGTGADQWLRIVMDREIRELIDSLSPPSLKVLEISGEGWNRPGLFREYHSVHHPEYDVCQQRLNETFDLIIAEQVFEHLLWPYRAGKNVYAMLRPGGHFLISTPFLVRIHNDPTDCSRWTETGLKYFLAECGFALADIQTGSWGNRACIRANFLKWQIYQTWRHSLHNEPHFPAVVWALAKKADGPQEYSDNTVEIKDQESASNF
jgi:SAM-dependent methyltransferase